MSDEEALRRLADITSTIPLEQLSGYAIGDSLPRLVCRPDSTAAVGQILAIANQAGFAVAPVGGRTRWHTGNPPDRYDIALDLTGLSTVHTFERDDLTITVDAGATIGAVDNVAGSANQQSMLDVAQPSGATVGGILASAEQGPLRLRFGPTRDSLLGASITLADGSIVNIGGRVVKNVAGYDLSRLMVGSFGTLGVLLTVTLRLIAIPDTTKLVITHLESEAAVKDWFRSSMRLQPDGLVAIRRATSWLGYLRISGNAAHVSARTKHLSGTHLEDGEALAEWRTLSAVSGEGTVCLRYAVPQSLLWSHPQFPLDRFSRIEGGGILFASGDLSSDDVQEARRWSASFGGNVAVERGIYGLSDTDAWSDPGTSLPLMRAIKAKLDPNRILNPGRFVAGI